MQGRRGISQRNKAVVINRSSSEITPMNSTSSASKRVHSKYAYAFVIGGCDPNSTSPLSGVPSYRFFLYNILVAAHILRYPPSDEVPADIILLVQMKYHVNMTVLPDVDRLALRKANIIVKYIPPSPHESFYRTVLDKFRVLSFTQYRRVLLLDADIMPLRNLDYLFQLSDQGVLRENMMVAGNLEPSNAGFFMVAPATGDLELINGIIQQREREAHHLPYPYFDPIRGWGHVIDPHDQWETLQEKRGSNWTFWAAFADQGLLFYFLKYVKQSVSIATKDGIQNWIPGSAGQLRRDGSSISAASPILEGYYPSLLQNYSLPSCNVLRRTKKEMPCQQPQRSFVHFSGPSKPWRYVRLVVASYSLSCLFLDTSFRPLTLNATHSNFSIPRTVLSSRVFNETGKNLVESNLHFWFQILAEVNALYDLGIDFNAWIAASQSREFRQTLGTNSVYHHILLAHTDLLEPLREIEEW
jgi:hypothetical protein